MYCKIEDFKKYHRPEIRKEYSDKLKYAGEFTEKAQRKLLMELSIYPDFALNDVWYEDCVGLDDIDEDEDNNCPVGYGDPTQETWIDVEGIGYGWYACTDDQEKNRKMLFNLIRTNTNDLIGYDFDIFEGKQFITYHIYCAERFYDYDVVININKLNSEILMF